MNQKWDGYTYYEESHVSSNLNSKLFWFHSAHPKSNEESQIILASDKLLDALTSEILNYS